MGFGTVKSFAVARMEEETEDRRREALVAPPSS